MLPLDIQTPPHNAFGPKKHTYNAFSGGIWMSWVQTNRSLNRQSQIHDQLIIILHPRKTTRKTKNRMLLCEH